MTRNTLTIFKRLSGIILFALPISTLFFYFKPYPQEAAHHEELLEIRISPEPCISLSSEDMSTLHVLSREEVDQKISFLYPGIDYEYCIFNDTLPERVGDKPTLEVEVILIESREDLIPGQNKCYPANYWASEGRFAVLEYNKRCDPSIDILNAEQTGKAEVKVKIQPKNWPVVFILSLLALTILEVEYIKAIIWIGRLLKANNTMLESKRK